MRRVRHGVERVGTGAVWAVRAGAAIVGVVEIGERTPFVGIEDKLVCEMRLVDEMGHVKVDVALPLVGHFVERPTRDGMAMMCVGIWM